MSCASILRACTGWLPATGRCAGPSGGWRTHRFGGVHPAVHELDPGEGAVLVHVLDETLVGGNVGVVPDPPFDVRGHVRRVVDLDLLGADHGPPALRLHSAHDRVRRRVAVPHAVAVRHLEEAVARRHGPDRHRLEEDVESWLAHGRQTVPRSGRAGRSFAGSTNGIAAVCPVNVPCSLSACNRWPGPASSIGTQT